MKTKSSLGPMLRKAKEAKARERGGAYTYRDLEADSKVHFSYAHKAINYGLRPSEDIVRAWSEALKPYLPLDDALMAAGYLPDDPGKTGVLQRLGRFATDVLEDLERRGRMVGLEGVPPQDEAADRQPDTDGQHKPKTHP